MAFRGCVRTEKKPQISPLRYAPVEMTNLLHGKSKLSSGCTPVHGLTNLSSRPERTQISYLAPLATPTYAAFCRERRMKPANATKLNRKSGEAEWRDLRFLFVHTPSKGPGVRFFLKGLLAELLIRLPGQCRFV